MEGSWSCDHMNMHECLHLRFEIPVLYAFNTHFYKCLGSYICKILPIMTNSTLIPLNRVYLRQFYPAMLSTNWPEQKVGQEVSLQGG